MSGKKNGTKVPSLDEARAAISQEKQDRAREFAEKLQALCQKYGCDITAQIQVVPLDK